MARSRRSGVVVLLSRPCPRTSSYSFAREPLGPLPTPAADIGIIQSVVVLCIVPARQRKPKPQNVRKSGPIRRPADVTRCHPFSRACRRQPSGRNVLAYLHLTTSPRPPGYPSYGHSNVTAYKTQPRPTRAPVSWRSVSPVCAPGTDWSQGPPECGVHRAWRAGVGLSAACQARPARRRPIALVHRADHGSRSSCRRESHRLDVADQ